MDKQKIFCAPLPTVRRLPAYLRLLRVLRANGKEFVSCTYIGAQLKLDPTQIRKDLAAAGAAGTPRIGYRVEALIASIEDFLGWNRPTNAVILGAEAIAQSILMNSQRFQEYCGLNFLAVFDMDPDMASKQIAGRDILPADRLADYVQNMHVHIGILTISEDLAQQAADLMVAAGIGAIWNFTHENIRVPANVTLENVDITASLATLFTRSAKLSQTQSQIQAQ